jgi:5-methylcytosine-specific restriction enzyme A
MSISGSGTGEGQIGDMEFVRGNKAIRDHVPNGKDLLLFEALGKGKGYRHLGQFICTTWEFRQGPDLQGNNRKVIVFHLVQPGLDSVEPLEIEDELKGLTLGQLRKRALQAATEAPQTSAKTARRTYYERSAAVKVYVLARANGICECCTQPAPFLRVDGTPYLEPHHTRRLSDGGPDDPRWVAGICPNCHRRIHHGEDGTERNVILQSRLAELESHATG